MNKAPRLAGQLGGFMLRRLKPFAPPFRLWLDITSRCNLRCALCAQPLLEDDQRRDMDQALLESLANQAPALGCEINLFHRGEPLLRPDLGRWTRRFRAGGNLVRIHSNATLLTPGRVADLLSNPPDLFTCSLDTLDPKAYAAARQGADLDKALAGVERLLAERAKAGLDQPRVALLLMGRQAWGPEQNQRLDRLKERGLDRVIWRAAHNWGGALGAASARRQPAVCTFPWYGLAVLSDGRVSPCPQDFFGQITLGRADLQGLGEIWQGEKARELRRAHRSHRLSPYPVCLNCDRIQRPTLLGIPTQHLKNFLAESIVGPRVRRRAAGKVKLKQTLGNQPKN